MTELQKRRHIEGMLRDTAERYKDLFVNSPIGIYRTDPDGRIMMANPTLIRMLGYKNTRSVSSSIKDGMIYEPTYFYGGIKDVLLKQGKVRGFEARWKRPDNTAIFVQENARAIYDKKGEVLFYDGTVEDITERKKAEKQIDSFQKKLRSLASELSLTEERERRRIAATLHDNLGQLLAILKIRLGAVTESKATESTKRELRDIRKYIQQGIDYTRSLIVELSPPILHELGLEPALEWLAEQIEEQHA
jgi:PAS domain S-box-containing protein